MHSIPVLIHRLSRAESGATAIEYGLLAALVAAVILVGVGSVGEALALIFDQIEEGMVAAASS